MEWGEGGPGFKRWGVSGPALVVFLFYVDVSGMRLRSRLFSQPVTILVPWVLLHVGWSISLAPCWVIDSRFLAGNRG